MILDVLNAVGDAGDVAETTIALRAFSSEVTTMMVGVCDMLISKERPEVLAAMKDLGRTSSESTLAYRWAMEQKNATPQDNGICNFPFRQVLTGFGWS